MSYYLVVIAYSLEGYLINTHKAWPAASKQVSGGKRQLKSSTHQETPKNAPLHVALLWLAYKGVAQAGFICSKQITGVM